MNIRTCALTLTAALLLGGCNDGKKPEGDGTPGAPPTSAQATPAAPGGPGAHPKVVVFTAQKENINLADEWTAETVASKTVEIRPQVTGTLETYTFREGADVGPGQLLFSIDPAQFQADVLIAKGQLYEAQAAYEMAMTQVDLKRALAELASAQARLLKTQQDVDRYTPLAKTLVIPQQTLDNAVAQRDVAAAQVAANKATVENTRINTRGQIQSTRAQVEAARAQVLSKEIRLGYCTIYSPTRGIIGKLQVDPGNLVGPSDPTPLATISQNDPIYAQFSISEDDYIRVSKLVSEIQSGRSVKRPSRAPFELLLADGSTYRRRGRLQMFERGLDTKTGTLMVRAVFDNPEGLLKPGQFARIRITDREVKDAVLVPQVAVTTLQAEQGVMVVTPDKKVESRTVVTNGTYKTFFIISSGLKAGEMVIVEGLQKVRPGMTVEPTEMEDLPNQGK